MNTQTHTFRSPEYRGVVEKVIDFFVDTPVHAVPPPQRFGGIGVYALYYAGQSEYYHAAASANEESLQLPIYVGKAVPTGWRTARRTSGKAEERLHNRLREHSRSIEQVSNLLVGDFSCRFTILDGIEADLIAGVEAQLIRRFEPLWNTVIDGFGNHDPGSGRYNQARSEWDVLHPGRSWADRLTGDSPVLDDILGKLNVI